MNEVLHLPPWMNEWMASEARRAGIDAAVMLVPRTNRLSVSGTKITKHTLEAAAASQGLDVGRVSVPAGGEELEIPVSAAAGAPDSVARVILVARDSASGRVLGQSAPVTVQLGGTK